jgi:hypothetical protein
MRRLLLLFVIACLEIFLLQNNREIDSKPMITAAALFATGSEITPSHLSRSHFAQIGRQFRDAPKSVSAWDV